MNYYQWFIISNLKQGLTFTTLLFVCFFKRQGLFIFFGALSTPNSFR